MLENIKETILTVFGTIRVDAKDFKKDIVYKVFYIINQFIKVDRNKSKDNKCFYKFEILEDEKQKPKDFDSFSKKKNLLKK